MCDLVNNACCFIGHRKIEVSKDIKNSLYNIIKDVIEEEKKNFKSV